MKFYYKEWFRLFKNNKLVGYKKLTNNNQLFYSIDNYGWSGKKIFYDNFDAFSKLYDFNDRPLFINDIIILRYLLDHNLTNKQYLISQSQNKPEIQLLPLNTNTNDIITDVNILKLTKNNIKFIAINQ